MGEVKRKVEVALPTPHTLMGVRLALQELVNAGAPDDAHLRITGGYPGAEDYYVAEATWPVAPTQEPGQERGE